MNNTQENKWRGYTLDEMRAERTALFAQCVIARETVYGRITQVFKQMTPPFGFKWKAISVVKDLFGNIKIMQYLMLGYKLSKIVFQLWRKKHK